MILTIFTGYQSNWFWCWYNKWPCFYVLK